MGAWSKKEREDFAKGASASGSLIPAEKPAAVEPPDGEMAQIDDGIKKMQAANAADPSLKDRLNAVAAARAKFFSK